MTARDRTVLVVVITLALVVGSWLLVIQPKRSQASKLGTQVSAAQSQLSAARSQVAAGDGGAQFLRGLLHRAGPPRRSRPGR